MKTVELSKGYATLVDDADFEAVSEHSWHVLIPRSGTPYAVGYVNGVRERLHRWLMKAPKGVEVDHENTDGLDNQRGNLRLATSSQNQHNKRAYRTNTSGYKGVSLDRRNGRWYAKLAVNGVQHNLGLHDTPEEANRVVCEARARFHGTFARNS
jgi:hypothetical protein